MKTLTALSVPLISVIILLAALYAFRPSATGLSVYSPEGKQLVDADVTLSTKESEILPKDAVIEVWLDEKKASMPVSDFIIKTKQSYDIKKGNFSDLYYGDGFTGDHDYRLALSDFNLDRNVEKGEHIFRTRIIYRQKILYEKEKKIVIAN